jgi:hypothetical protein
MTEKTEFSLDIPVDSTTGFKPLPDWVAFDLCKAYPATGGNLLLYNSRNGQRAMVRPEVYASLLSCNQFKTLDQHVANIVARNPGMRGQQTDIRNVLDSMLKSGIMVSAKQTVDDLKRKPLSTARNKEQLPPVVAIITWERPQALERLLGSIVENCATDKLQCLYVIDDSSKNDNKDKNRGLVELFSSRIDAPLHYIGQSEQRSLLDKLAGKLPHREEAIRFLADHARWSGYWTGGLARNLALLLSCGRRLVMMDDDSLCDIYNPRQAKPDICISDSPREADFFASRQDWAGRHQTISPDPVDRHLQCLGLTFSEALQVLGENHLKPAGFANATALITSELQKDSPVLTTECGSVGCPGTVTNTWLPDMAPDSIKRMLASAQTTRNALTSRQVWCGRNKPHFSPRPNMSAVTGFDNQYLLPPYLPMTRGEDRLFGNMLDFLFPNGVNLDYPWAVPHLPIPEREWREEHLDFSAGNTFPMFFIDKVVEQKDFCLAGEPIQRLAALASWFESLATATDDALVASYRDSKLRNASELMQKLESLLSVAGSAPTEWQEYLKNGVEQLTGDLDLASRGALPLKGGGFSLEGDELITFWKDVWSGFAAALNAWPEIRQAATEIIEKDFV